MVYFLLLIAGGAQKTQFEPEIGRILEYLSRPLECLVRRGREEGKGERASDGRVLLLFSEANRNPAGQFQNLHTHTSPSGAVHARHITG